MKGCLLAAATAADAENLDGFLGHFTTGTQRKFRKKTAMLFAQHEFALEVLDCHVIECSGMEGTRREVPGEAFRATGRCGRRARHAAGEWLLDDQPGAGQDDAAVIGGFLLSDKKPGKFTMQVERVNVKRTNP
jgi:hypothetical protein